MRASPLGSQCFSVYSIIWNGRQIDSGRFIHEGILSFIMRRLFDLLPIETLVNSTKGITGFSKIGGGFISEAASIALDKINILEPRLVIDS